MDGGLCPFLRDLICRLLTACNSLTLQVLTTSILLGWTALVIALRSAGHGPTGGAIRDAIRDALNVEAQPHFGSLSAMAGGESFSRILVIFPSFRCCSAVSFS